jgi:hypothetical protein
MTTTIELNANELDNSLLDAIKLMFRGRNIRLTVEADMDETEYLNKSEANVAMLTESIAQLRKGQLTIMSPEQL